MAICRMSVTSLLEPQFVSYCLWLHNVSGKRLRDTDSVKPYKWQWVRFNRRLRTSDSCTDGIGTELITSSDIHHRSCVTLHTHSWNTCRDSWKYVNWSEFLSSGLEAPGYTNRSRVWQEYFYNSMPTVYRVLQVFFIRVRKIAKSDY